MKHIEIKAPDQEILEKAIGVFRKTTGLTADVQPAPFCDAHDSAISSIICFKTFRILNMSKISSLVAA